MKDLITQYLEAKRLEREAEARRVELGEAIAAALGAPAEGSKTYDVGDHKVTVKQPVNRKVDWTAFDQIALEHPDKHAPVAMKRELDTKGLHWIQENEPDFYRALAAAITATPGRISIEIKEAL